MKSFICEFCGISCPENNALTRHIKTAHYGQSFKCVTCNTIFNRMDNLRKHWKKKQGKCTPTTFITSTVEASVSRIPTTTTTTSSVRAPAPIHTISAPSTTTSAPSTTTAVSSTSSTSSSSTYCISCGKNVDKKLWIYHQRTNEHKRNSGLPLNDTFKTLSTGFAERLESLYYENNIEGELNSFSFLSQMKLPLIHLMQNMLIKHTAIKFNMELFAEYVKMTDETAIVEIKSHQTKMVPVLQSTGISDVIDDMFIGINNKMSEFQEKDSGWTLIKITHVEVNINKYQPLQGSSHIHLPKFISDKKACINIINKDVYCFKWSVISAVRHVNSHTNRCESYGIRNIRADLIEISEVNLLLNFSGLIFPMPVRDIKKFEQQNNSISINVFGYDDELKKVVGPYHITTQEKVSYKLIAASK